MPTKDRADHLAGLVAEQVDKLIEQGYHPGEVTYAYTVAAAIAFKAYGSNDVSAVKALVCETIDETWRADDAALAEGNRKHRKN